MKEVELIDRLCAKATERCRAEFKQIEQEISPCFQTNPGRKLTKERCGELMHMLDELEVEERSAFSKR